MAPVPNGSYTPSAFLGVGPGWVTEIRNLWPGLRRLSALSELGLVPTFQLECPRFHVASRAVVFALAGEGEFGAVFTELRGC